MRVFILLLIVFAAVTYAGTHSNRVDDDHLKSNNTVEIVLKIDKLLTKIDHYVNILKDASLEEMSYVRSICLKLVDFGRPKEERREIIRQLLEDIPEEDMIYWEPYVNIVLSVLDNYEELAPNSGYLVLTSAVKMITSPKFVFGSHDDRRRIILGDFLDFVGKVMESSEMTKEFEKIRNNKEHMILSKKLFNIEL